VVIRGSAFIYNVAYSAMCRPFAPILSPDDISIPFIYQRVLPRGHVIAETEDRCCQRSDTCKKYRHRSDMDTFTDIYYYLFIFIL